MHLHSLPLYKKWANLFIGDVIWSLNLCCSDQAVETWYAGPVHILAEKKLSIMTTPLSPFSQHQVTASDF